MNRRDYYVVAVAVFVIWAGCSLAAYQALGRQS